MLIMQHFIIHTIVTLCLKNITELSEHHLILILKNHILNNFYRIIIRIF